MISAADKFEIPTTRVNELWQIDFTYMKVVHWGWYYLSCVLDDYSRYIIAWRLCQTMTVGDVKQALDIAIAKTGVKHVHVLQKPKLLSDNDSAFIASELKKYLDEQKIRHIRSMKSKNGLD